MNGPIRERHMAPYSVPGVLYTNIPTVEEFMNDNDMRQQVILVDENGNKMGMLELLQWAKTQGYEINCTTRTLRELMKRYREQHPGGDNANKKRYST